MADAELPNESFWNSTVCDSLKESLDLDKLAQEIASDGTNCSKLIR
jgi:hypothetical protein